MKNNLKKTDGHTTIYAFNFNSISKDSLATLLNPLTYLTNFNQLWRVLDPGELNFSQGIFSSKI